MTNKTLIILAIAIIIGVVVMLKIISVVLWVYDYLTLHTKPYVKYKCVSCIEDKIEKIKRKGKKNDKR